MWDGVLVWDDMYGMVKFAGLMAGGVMLAVGLGSALQMRATSGHRVDSSYAPDAEAGTDQWGWRVVPKAEQPPKSQPGKSARPLSWANQA